MVKPQLMIRMQTYYWSRRLSYEFLAVSMPQNNASFYGLQYETFIEYKAENPRLIKLFRKPLNMADLLTLLWNEKGLKIIKK